MKSNSISMKTAFLAFLTTLLTIHFSCAQMLRTSPDQRYLEDQYGNTFVWIGDTAWELFHRLNREESVTYLENRAAKGYTVIQAVVLAENDGLRTPNPYGEVPFKNLDPTQPNEAYFEHVDFIVDKAAALGLVVGMLPTWGDKVYSENPGAGPIVFNAENAAVFGAFLGQRYRDKPIVWILGGDRNIANDEVLEIWRAMARGIKEGDLGQHLITYHPRGTSISSFWLHNEPWLDFNMYQSGHDRHFNDVYKYAEDLLSLHPRKPFVEGEPAYEDIPVQFWEFIDFGQPMAKRYPQGTLSADGLVKDTSFFAKGFFTDWDSRIFAYWNFLSGACGYTYGNNAIWQMYKKGGPAAAIPPLTDWQEAMERPGSQDMEHVRALFETRPLGKIQPDQSMVYGRNPDGKYHVRAAGATDRSFALVYLATGQKVRLVMGKVKGKMVDAWWFNPRDGRSEKIGAIPNEGLQEFTPPTTGEAQDWLLVIDQQDAHYPAPGEWKP